MKDLPYKEFNTENELKVLNYWTELEILKKIENKNKNGEKFYFLQGPPYTSGKLHTGHAWNHSLKDFVLRYKRMKGYDVLARAGYDMHGLPTELKVQKKLNLKQKEDIIEYGYDKFVNECINWSIEKSNEMNEDIKKLGVTLDFSDPYKPISQDYMDSVWYLIKKADEKNRLYLGEKTMLWCPETETALAKHEVEYKEIKDDSIFLKFKKFGTDNEYFIIWTTTPWTIPFNLAIMVNPDMEYVDCTVTHKGVKETWTICKDLAGIFLSNLDDCKYEIQKPYFGSDLKGKKYIHPWATQNEDIIEMQKEFENIFTVLLSSEYVDSSAGTGLVHCAPGCGPEDYEVGQRNNLPPYNIINEKGIFPNKIAKFAGLVAKKDDKKFIKMMKEDGFLITTSPIEHEYPFSERAKVPVVFRTTKQWFFKVEDLKKEMLEINSQTYWHPQSAKNAFKSWLDNLRDNSITKQRIWGTPAPIWVDKNNDGEIIEYFVVGSREELEKLVGKSLPDNLHKPWIDEVTFISPKTGKELRRIPDVLDVWIDAGCASWGSLYYPKRKDLFNKYFPADFIIEGKDQIRGWFNLLMVAGILGLDRQVFKNVSMHGFISGVDGVKMSKSLGNIIDPDEIIEKTSVDNFRYYFGQTKAGEDISFSWDQILLYQRHLTILWNVSKYTLDLLAEYDFSKEKLIEYKEFLDEEDKYIISKLHSTIKNVTENFESYKLDLVPKEIGEFILCLSRNYIQAIRDKISRGNYKGVIYTLHSCLSNLIKILSPVCPFITEMIFQNLKSISELKEESIHYFMWPEFDESLINDELVNDFESTLNIISGILGAREKAQLNVRQPLSKAILISKNKELLESATRFKNMILTQTNIKEIDLVKDFDKLEYGVKANFKALSEDFGQKTAEIGIKINNLGKSTASKMHDSFAEGLTYDLDGESIKEKHIEFSTSVKEPYFHMEISKGLIAIDSELNEELLNEGLAREFTRRIQNERKKLNLVKFDKIKVIIDNAEIFLKIKPFIESIKETCGISEITQNNFKDGISLKIKNTEFSVSISVE